MQRNLTKKTEVKTELVEEFTFTKKELQHLIDIYFEVIMVSMTNLLDYKVTKEEFYKDSGMGKDGLRNKYMRNAAHHLRESCGIDTHPIGMSWGAIVNEEFRKTIPVEKR
jgi:hypothetical protein